uniref:(northern house mosquito) hypothetical protein n=1 Tax=Culex pipiens TaxID=7175 RepID=A0A8D8CKL3_CULPI
MVRVHGTSSAGRPPLRHHNRSRSSARVSRQCGHPGRVHQLPDAGQRGSLAGRPGGGTRPLRPGSRTVRGRTESVGMHVRFGGVDGGTRAGYEAVQGCDGSGFGLWFGDSGHFGGEVGSDQGGLSRL